MDTVPAAECPVCLAGSGLKRHPRERSRCARLPQLRHHLCSSPAEPGRNPRPVCRRIRRRDRRLFRQGRDEDAAVAQPRTGAAPVRSTGSTLSRRRDAAAASWSRPRARLALPPPGLTWSRPRSAMRASIFRKASFSAAPSRNLPPLSPDPFDVVYSSEVIEHVPDVRSFARTIARLLRPGGVLYITTPDLTHWSQPRDLHRRSGFGPPAHCVYFTPQSLIGLLDGAGFDLVRRRLAFKPGIKLICRRRHDVSKHRRRTAANLGGRGKRGIARGGFA